MVNRFQKVAERLKGKGQTEIKQTPLRMPKDLYEEYQQVCKDLGSNVNEFTVELIRLSLEEYEADQRKDDPDWVAIKETEDFLDRLEKEKKETKKAAPKRKKKTSKVNENKALVDSEGKDLAGTDKVINSLTGNSKKESK